MKVEVAVLGSLSLIVLSDSGCRKAYSLHTVSRLGLAVRRLAGKQKELGGPIPLLLYFLFKKCNLRTLSRNFISHS